MFCEDMPPKNIGLLLKKSEVKNSITSATKADKPPRINVLAIIFLGSG
jgi:hypothetical protein